MVGGDMKNCQGVAKLEWCDTSPAGFVQRVYLRCTHCGQLYRNLDVVNTPLSFWTVKLGSDGVQYGHRLSVTLNECREFLSWRGGRLFPAPDIDPDVALANTPVSDDQLSQEQLDEIMSIIGFTDDWELQLFDSDNIFGLMDMHNPNHADNDIIDKMLVFQDEDPGDIPVTEELETQIDNAMSALFDETDDEDIDKYLGVFGDFLDGKV